MYLCFCDQYYHSNIVIILVFRDTCLIVFAIFFINTTVHFQTTMPRSSYNLIKLSKEIWTADSAINFLRSHSLLKNAAQCDKCGSTNDTVCKAPNSNYHYFPCLNCKTKKSIRSGTFFSAKHTGLRTILLLIYNFVMFSSLTISQKIHEVVLVSLYLYLYANLSEIVYIINL